MEQRYVSAVARALGVDIEESGIERAASIFMDLEFDYAHLRGEVMHGLTKDAMPEMTRRIRRAYEDAKKWADSTTRYDRVIAGQGKGQLLRIDRDEHRVATLTAEYLERILEKRGGPNRSSFYK